MRAAANTTRFHRRQSVLLGDLLEVDSSRLALPTPICVRAKRKLIWPVVVKWVRFGRLMPNPVTMAALPLCSTIGRSASL
jgi:hypothetical protein